MIRKLFSWLLFCALLAGAPAHAEPELLPLEQAFRLSAQVIDSHYSVPLGVLSRDINKRSNNFMAEQVLKALGADSSGRPGSWQKGLQAVSRYLEGMGILPGKKAK